MNPDETLRYPTGRFQRPSRPLEGTERRELIDKIERTPSAIRAAVDGLSDAQLDTPYRPGGWTLRQVVHHVPDSHLNAYIRMKLALTEDVPTIKPYDEARWAQLDDSKTTPIETSLTLTIQPGAELRFAPGTYLFVHGGTLPRSLPVSRGHRAGAIRAERDRREPTDPPSANAAAQLPPFPACAPPCQAATPPSPSAEPVGRSSDASRSPRTSTGASSPSKAAA